MWLNLPVGRKSSSSMGFPVRANLSGLRFAWTAMVSFVHRSALDGGLCSELLWKREYHSSVERLGMSKMLLFDVQDVMEESDAECDLVVLPSIWGMSLLKMDMTDWLQSIGVGDLVVFHGILFVFDPHENLGCCCSGFSVVTVFVVIDSGGVAGKLATSL